MKKLDADPWGLQSFEHHLIYFIKLRGLRTFNFEGEFCIWIHSNIFPGKGFWFYGNLTGNIRYLTRFSKPDIFGNKPVQRRKKGSAIIRTCRFHQSHLISGTVALVDITKQTRVYHYIVTRTSACNFTVNKVLSLEC